MAGLRSAGLLSVALLAAIGHAAPFSVLTPRDDEASCPYIPMSVDPALDLYPNHNGTNLARSMWVRTPEGYRISTPATRSTGLSDPAEVDSALAKRADGAKLWDWLQEQLDEDGDDAPCFNFKTDKWHDYKGPRPTLPYKSLRPIYDELDLPVGEYPDHQSFEDRNYGKNKEDQVYRIMSLRYYEDGYDEDASYTGHFTQQMSVANGVIAAIENERAVYRDEDGKIKFKVPANWKDATWYQWQRLAAMEGEDVTNLKYIVQYDVANDISKQFIIDAFDGDNIYKTKSFEPGDDTFNKLLGSPNGSGIPKFLVANKNALGKKTIESISIRAIPGEEREIYVMWLTLTEFDD